jgi:hypothetical protein
MPDKLRSPEYPDAMKVLKLDQQGKFKPINRTSVALSKLLKGEPVGLLKTDEDAYQVFYGSVLLATIALHQKEVRVLRVK